MRTIIKRYQKKDTLNLLVNLVSRGTFEDILTSLNSSRCECIYGASKGNFNDNFLKKENKIETKPCALCYNG